MTKTSNNLPETTKLTPQMIKFIDLLFTEKDTITAARKAGYAESSCNSTVYTLLGKPYIQNKILEEYRARSASNIPKLAQIEGKIFKQVHKNPKRYKEYKDVFKQAKQHVGLLSEDHTPKQPTVNIAHIEKVQVAIGDMLSKRLEGNNE